MEAEAAMKRIQSEVGIPSKTEKIKPLKDIVTLYTGGVVKMELSIKRKWNEFLQDFGEKEPDLMCIVAGTFVNLPKDYESLKEFGNAILVMAESIKGVQFGSPLSPETIVDARSKLAEFIKDSE